MDEVISTTFYVVDNDDYHWILGLPLLASLQGKVLCSERRLEYTPPNGTSRQIPLIPRTHARDQPVRATFRLRSPHLESECVEAVSWQDALLHQEEAEYVGEGLACILGR